MRPYLYIVCKNTGLILFILWVAVSWHRNQRTKGNVHKIGK